METVIWTGAGLALAACVAAAGYRARQMSDPELRRQFLRKEWTRVRPLSQLPPLVEGARTRELKFDTVNFVSLAEAEHMVHDRRLAGVCETDVRDHEFGRVTVPMVHVRLGKLQVKLGSITDARAKWFADYVPFHVCMDEHMPGVTCDKVPMALVISDSAQDLPLAAEKKEQVNQLVLQATTARTFYVCSPHGTILASVPAKKD